MSANWCTPEPEPSGVDVDADADADADDSLVTAGAALVDDLVAAATVALGVGDDRALARGLVLVEQAMRRLEATAVAIAGDVDLRGLYGVDGHRNIRGWIDATVLSSGAETRHRARTARLAHAFPQVADAMVSGRLGVGQARELARVYANPRVKDRLGEVIDPFITVATLEDYDLFVQRVREWERLVDADGAHRNHEDCHRHRRAVITTVGNSVHLDAAFGTAQGAAMTTILERFADAQFHQDWDELRARVGDDARPDLLERTPTQRRADALYAIFVAAATREPGAGAVPEPLVNIVITEAVYDAALTAMETGTPFRPPVPGASAFHPTGSEPCDTTLADTAGFCRTTTGIPIDPFDAVIASLTGHVRRVVIGGDGVIINLGRRRRCVTGSARDAALLQAALDRNGRCLWPGCRHTLTQIDHTKPWGDHGVSDVANTGPACGRHNRIKARGYTTWRDPHGHWHLTRPDGTPIQPV